MSHKPESSTESTATANNDSRGSQPVRQVNPATEQAPRLLRNLPVKNDLV